MYRKGKDPVYLVKISKLERLGDYQAMMLRRMAFALKANRPIVVKALCMTDEIRDEWAKRFKALGATMIPEGSFMLSFKMTPEEIGVVAALGVLPKPRGGGMIATKALPS